MSFENKIVLITGAGSGIGAAAAIMFAKEGAIIVAVDINEETVKDVGAQIESIGKKPLVIQADVSKDEEAKAIIEEIMGKLGKLDVLVNNAGIVKMGYILDLKILKVYDEIVPTNLRAVIHLTMLAAPHLIKSKGNIVNISSATSRSINAIGYMAYSVTKAGVEHFTRGAALELAPSGVRVNSVHPGPVWTNALKNRGDSARKTIAETTALKRVSEPEEIGNLIMFLASEKAKSITGSAYICDNGYLIL